MNSTADYATRSKLTQELAKIIDDGLYYYEQDLWDNNRVRNLSSSTSSLSKIGVIDQETFDKLANRQPSKIVNPVYIPPPPPPSYADSYLEENMVELTKQLEGLISTKTEPKAVPIKNATPRYAIVSST